MLGAAQVSPPCPQKGDKRRAKIVTNKENRRKYGEFLKVNQVVINNLAEKAAAEKANKVYVKSTASRPGVSIFLLAQNSRPLDRFYSKPKNADVIFYDSVRMVDTRDNVVGYLQAAGFSDAEIMANTDASNVRKFGRDTYATIFYGDPAWVESEARAIELFHRDHPTKAAANKKKEDEKAAKASAKAAGQVWQKPSIFGDSNGAMVTVIARNLPAARETERVHTIKGTKRTGIKGAEPHVLLVSRFSDEKKRTEGDVNGKVLDVSHYPTDMKKVMWVPKPKTARSKKSLYGKYLVSSTEAGLAAALAVLGISSEAENRKWTADHAERTAAVAVAPPPDVNYVQRLIAGTRTSAAACAPALLPSGGGAAAAAAPLGGGLLRPRSTSPTRPLGGGSLLGGQVLGRPLGSSQAQTGNLLGLSQLGQQPGLVTGVLPGPPSGGSTLRSFRPTTGQSLLSQGLLD